MLLEEAAAERLAGPRPVSRQPARWWCGRGRSSRARRRAGQGGARLPAGPAEPGAAAGKLSSNEAPLGPSPEVRAAIAASLASGQPLPRAGPGRRRSGPVRGAGDRPAHTDERERRALLPGGQPAARPGPGGRGGRPCYQIDATASLLSGASLRRVPLLADGGHDLEAMAKASAGASVVWLPSPHNPTGVACDPRELGHFLAEVPEDCLVVLDEAYRAFSDPERQPRCRRSCSPRTPTCSCSAPCPRTWRWPACGSATGWASAPLVEALSRARPPFSVNVLALAAIEAGVASEQLAGHVRGHGPPGASPGWNAPSARLGAEYFPSQANFVTARLDLERLGPALAASGTVVRSRGRPRDARVGHASRSVGRRKWRSCAASCDSRSRPGDVTDISRKEK